MAITEPITYLAECEDCGGDAAWSVATEYGADLLCEDCWDMIDWSDEP
jgi:hypothetical protein